MRHSFPSAAAAAFGVVLAGAAHAHGRFPGATGITFEPGKPDHALVRTTFGCLVPPGAATRPATGSAGGTSLGGWRWICSPAVGYDANKEDPPFVFAGNTVLLGTFDGLAASR